MPLQTHRHETLIEKPKHHWLPSLAWLIPLLALAIWLRFDRPVVSGFLDVLELRTLDARFLMRGPHSERAMQKIAQQVAIVAIDDEATQRFGRVLPRSVHGQLVQRLQAAGAQAIIFDVLFTDPSFRGLNDDVTFARASDTSRCVFLPFDDNSSRPTPPLELLALQKQWSYALGTPPQRGEEALESTSRAVVRVRPPIDVLRAAVNGGGHVATTADGDGKFRSSVLLLDLGEGGVFPHVALDAVARQVWKLDGRQSGAVTLNNGWLQIGKRRIGPLVRRQLTRSYRDFRSRKVSREVVGLAWMMPLNFMGDHETMQQLTIPYSAVLDGSAADVLKGRIVIVGETATGTPDLRPGPYDRRDIFLGVETNATLLANLLNNDFLHYPPRSWALLAMLLCGGAAGLSIALCRPAWAVAATAATLGLYFVLAVALFMSQNLVLEMAGTLWAATLCFVGMSIYRLVFIDRAARESEMALQESQALLGQFVDPALARELSENRDLRQSMQIGTRREVTILFSDIRGFTSWSDQQPPEEVVARLGEYFPIMCEIARDEYDGFLDKFIGDALMVTWNAFKDQPDHATVAVRAALSMQRALDVLNAGWQKQGQAGFRVGIGIATGRVVCGTFGSPHYKLQPTVLGDSVNFASRLETATKEYGCRIIISQSTFEMLDDEFEVRPLGTVAIRGKSEPQTIYEVSGDRSRPLPPERTTLLFPKAGPPPLQALDAPTHSTLSAANAGEERTG